jgi:hypothetical protein
VPQFTQSHYRGKREIFIGQDSHRLFRFVLVDLFLNQFTILTNKGPRVGKLI